LKRKNPDLSLRRRRKISFLEETSREHGERECKVFDLPGVFGVQKQGGRLEAQGLNVIE